MQRETADHNKVLNHKRLHIMLFKADNVHPYLLSQFFKIW